MNMITNNYTNGNAFLDGLNYRGWFIGAFIGMDKPLNNNQNVEVKFAQHKQGEEREIWSASDTTTTLCLLISGKFKIFFEKESILLENQGDYVIFLPKTMHKWIAIEDSIILTVRYK